MATQKNQLKAGVALSYVYIAMNAIVNLAYTPIMLRLLGKSQYGLYTLVAAVVSYLGLLSFGISGAYLRFYAREKETDDPQAVGRLNAMFLTVFSVLSLITLIAGIVLSCYAGPVFGDKLTAAELAEAKRMVVLLTINLVLGLITSVFSSFVIAHEKFVFQKVIAILSVVASPFISFPLLLAGVGPRALVDALLVVSAITLVANVVFCFQKLSMPFCFRGLQFGLLKEIYVFSLFLFLNQVIDQINWNVDSYLLGRFWGTREVGIYGLASRLNQLYLAFSVAISSVFAPRINRIVAKKENVDEQLNGLFIRVGRMQALLLFLLLLGLITLGKPFLIWMGGDPEFVRAYPALLLLVVPVTVPLIQNLGIEIQRAKNRHQFRSIIYGIMAVINVLISIPLCKKYGSTGAAIGTAVSLVVGNFLLMNWYYEKHLGIAVKEFWKNILQIGKGMLIPVAYCVACGVFVHVYTALSFLAVGAGLLLTYGVSMWFFGTNADEKELFRRLFTRFFGRKTYENHL